MAEKSYDKYLSELKGNIDTVCDLVVDDKENDFGEEMDKTGLGLDNIECVLSADLNTNILRFDIIRLPYNYDSQKDFFSIGKKIALKLGYVYNEGKSKKMETVFTGNIVKRTARYTKTTNKIVETIECHDPTELLAHRMRTWSLNKGEFKNLVKDTGLKWLQGSDFESLTIDDSVKALAISNTQDIKYLSTLANEFGYKIYCNEDGKIVGTKWADINKDKDKNCFKVSPMNPWVRSVEISVDRKIPNKITMNKGKDNKDKVEVEGKSVEKIGETKLSVKPIGETFYSEATFETRNELRKNKESFKDYLSEIMLKRGFGCVKGKAYFKMGYAELKVGHFIKLGDNALKEANNFVGTFFITGVKHKFNSGGYTTECSFQATPTVK